MAEGKRRKLAISKSSAASPEESVDNESVILEGYTEAIFYECGISSQYTANIQTLFKIEDIVQRMSNQDFAKELTQGKARGTALIEQSVNKWIKQQSESIQQFFAVTPIRQATLVLIQRAGISCNVDEKVYRHSVDGEKAVEMGNAIDLLRYPLVMMEKMQRARSGSLLDLETDAPMLIDMGTNLGKDVLDIKNKLASLKKDRM